MKYQNEMKLRFPSRSANEAFARTAVSAFLAQLDPTVEETRISAPQFQKR